MKGMSELLSKPIAKSVDMEDTTQLRWGTGSPSCHAVHVRCVGLPAIPQDFSNYEPTAERFFLIAHFCPRANLTSPYLRRRKLVGAVGVESTDCLETKEFCGAAWPSKGLEGNKRDS